MRGWNLIYRAASIHPGYYESWVAKAEGRIIQRFCAERAPASRPPSIGCLILGPGVEQARRTLRSVRASLGPAVPVWTNVAMPVADGAMPVADGTMQIADGSPLGEGLAGPEPDWLLPLRAGDTLSPALGAILARVAHDRSRNPALGPVIFWDEDRLHDGRRRDPWVKPGYDPMLFGDGDGVIGAGLIAMPAIRAAAKECATRADLAGVTDAVARILAVGDLAPLHLPLILTHRCFDVGVNRPVGDKPSRGRPLPSAPPVWPHVSIIIPMRDRPALLRSCLAGLRMLTYPGRVTITVVDNDSIEAETHALLAQLKHDGAADVLPCPGAFNFAAMINHAVENTSGDVLCLLNNDVEPRDGRWLETMVRHAVQEEIGAVGARLLYADGTIQHAGIAIGTGGAAGHVQKGISPDEPRFHHWHARSRTVSAVTAACMVLERSKFQAAGGMDAATWAVDFNDVDLCLKLVACGMRNVLTVEATLVHHESQSRGTRRSPEASERFARELEALQSRWATRTWQDPHHSVRFRREAEQCILAF
ncbi:glycosyltransferase family 2 protein [uncultured Sphingomonas sp.]|uniref:glycosyltransferase family 2 protein n=1 Tax=uncultured Sphingomonas sp. TaxID=158754 RepID=UPI0035CA4476